MSEQANNDTEKVPVVDDKKVYRYKRDEPFSLNPFLEWASKEQMKDEKKKEETKKILEKLNKN